MTKLRKSYRMDSGIVQRLKEIHQFLNDDPERITKYSETDALQYCINVTHRLLKDEDKVIGY